MTTVDGKESGMPICLPVCLSAAIPLVIKLDRCIIFFCFPVMCDER